MTARRFPASVLVLLVLGAACVAIALGLLGLEVPPGDGMGALGKMLVAWGVLLLGAPLLLLGVAGVLVHALGGSPPPGGALPRATARRRR